MIGTREAQPVSWPVNPKEEAEASPLVNLVKGKSRQVKF